MRGHNSIVGLAALAAMSLGAAPAPEEEQRKQPIEPGPEPADTPPTDSDVIPDRVSLENGSPHYFNKWRDIGVRFNGGERNSVLEFCVSEGWIRTQIFHGGRPKMERGKFIGQRLNGIVEPYWRRRT